MGKLRKRGQEGESTLFMTKGKAMRRLQVTPQQFHRLCILKGIFPREPKKRKDPTKTYYHIKDVRFLGSELLLKKFHDIDSWVKKFKKARGRKDESKAKTLLDQKPEYTLHHLLKERYPSFLDALKDLDDALSLVCLFASCPSNKDLRISADLIRTSERLWHEFEVYLMATRSLRKVFLSVKGIYYQAEVKGQAVTWLVPYQFTQHLPLDVDYTVMTTFLEFYHTLLKFVLFKLYSEANISYPPNLARPIEAILAEANWSLPEEISSDFATAPEVQQMRKLQAERQRAVSLFSGMVFLLGRETPRYSLELVIRGCGGTVVEEDSPQVTHQIVDRPSLEQRTDRELVQPQWVFDCLNFRLLLPLQTYRPAQKLPPHLSPFVDYTAEGHIPERLTEILQLKGEEIVLEPEVAEQKQLGKMLMSKKIRKLYERIQFSLRKRRVKTERLKERAGNPSQS
jgi:pescadillo protein